MDNRGNLSLTLRRPPPPPPIRTSSTSSSSGISSSVSGASSPASSLLSKGESYSQGYKQKQTLREGSPESGISVTSSSSSLPSAASLEVSANDQDSVNNSNVQFNSTRLNDDSPFLRDLSLSLQNASLLSSSLNSVANTSTLRQEKDVSYGTMRKPAPKPPVRTDSIKTTRKRASKFRLEDRFMEKFYSLEHFPPPSPFSNCTKTYPSKELFSSPSKSDDQTQDKAEQEDKEKVDVPDSHKVKSKTKSRRFSHLLFLRNSFSTGDSSVKDRCDSVGSLNDSCPTDFKSDIKKPEVARKPMLSRDLSFKVKNKKTSLVSRSKSVCSPMRPKVKIRNNVVTTEDKENVNGGHNNFNIHQSDNLTGIRRAPPPPI